MNYHPYLWPAFKRRLVRSSAPILAGPFLGEVGIESLYWLSFLEALKQAGVKPERIIPITRAGAGCLYQTPTAIEVLDMRTPQDLRVQHHFRKLTTGMVKQHRWNAFDRELVKDTVATLNLKRYHVLHPSWMYQTLEPYWVGKRGLDWLNLKAPYTFVPPPALPEGVTLPEIFVTVRFYFRTTFEYKHESLQLAKHAVKRLASQYPVILLNTEQHADDHRDLEFKNIPNVSTLKDYLDVTPQNALGVQAAVMARSIGFVGTYGGLAQLAQRLGKAAVTFYTQWGGTMLSHKHLSDAIAIRTGLPFLVHAVKELPVLGTVLPETTLQPVATMVR